MMVIQQSPHCSTQVCFSSLQSSAMYHAIKSVCIALCCNLPLSTYQKAFCDISGVFFISSAPPLRFFQAQIESVHSHNHSLYFHRRISLSTVHLTDLDYIFVCRATLDSFGDIDNGGVYSNGHHLYWDSYCFASEHGSVQNLRVLETERESNQHSTSGGPGQVSNPPNSSRSVITSSKRIEKVPKQY